MSAIVADNLTRDFGNYRAVDGLTFSVARGEIYGFLGPNGAGKTTTIRMLIGRLRPTFGTAEVAGCDVVRDRAALKPRIGVVFEVQNIYEQLSARDNLRFSARLYRVNDARVEQALRQVGLEAQADKRTKIYSNGMKQRLLIARALLHDPQVLFMDEPTRGLDPTIAQEIRTVITQLAANGKTIFLTTHYLYEADALCDQIAILNQGRIIAQGSPDYLKTHCGKTQHSSLEDVFISLTGTTLSESVEDV